VRQPWQLPGLDLAHHALPLPTGRWRGPLPRDQPAIGLLETEGIYLQEFLADGAGAYALGPTFDAMLESTEAPSLGSATWVAARIKAGFRAYHRPLKASRYMAILNLTEDSFSDGGQLLEPSDLWTAAQQAVGEQASWLDLGAESTRPGARDIPPVAQIQRLLPAIELLLPLGVPISIDTRSAEVAHACLEAGASMINDVSALADPQMASICGAAECSVVLMHMRGTPRTMQSQTTYPDLLGSVADELCGRVAFGLQQGLNGSQIILDPGLGFAKTATQNRQLLAQVGALRALGFPLLVGPSRKSFLAELLPSKQAAQRDCGSAGAAASCAMQGVAILRMHSGRYWEAVQVASSIARSGAGTLSPVPTCTTKD
jgi:dihydropteroate synthase